MKRIVVIFVSAILLVAFTVNTAAAQPPHAKAYGKQKFYYYPGSNVYYAPGTKQYYYNPGSAWTGVSVLPPGFNITAGAPRYVVYHTGPEVWVDNRVHVIKYKAPKKPKAIKYKQHKKPGKKHH